MAASASEWRFISPPTLLKHSAAMVCQAHSLRARRHIAIPAFKVAASASEWRFIVPAALLKHSAAMVCQVHSLRARRHKELTNYLLT